MMKKFEKEFKSATLATLFSFSTSVMPLPALADPTANPSPPTNVGASLEKVSEVSTNQSSSYCDTICSNQSAASKSITGDPGAPWGSDDDTLCAGVIINNNNTACSVQITPAVAALASKVKAGNPSTPGSCTSAANIFSLCQIHANPTTLGPLCSAYNGATNPLVTNGEIGLMTVESLTVAACAIATVLDFTGSPSAPIADRACAALGIIDGVTEIGITTAMTTNANIQAYLDNASIIGMNNQSFQGTFEGLGAAQVVVGGVAGVTSLRGGPKPQDAEGAANGGKAGKGANQSSKKLVEEVADTSAKKSSKRMAGSAIGLALATATLGMRAAAFQSIQNAGQNTCRQIMSLAGGPSIHVGPGSGIAGGGSSTNVTATVGSSGSGSPQATLNSFMSCTQSGGSVSTCASQNGVPLSSAASAALGPILNQPDASNQLNSALPNLNAVMSAAGSGGAGAAMGTATPGGLPQSLADELKGFQNVVAQELPNLSTHGLSNPAATSGGMARNQASTTDLLTFGQNRNLASASNTTALQFKGAALDPRVQNSSDIWHTDWKGSIFQIISARTSQSASQVEQLEWSTPLNRAMHGLKNTPASINAKSAATSLHPLILPR